MPPPDPGESPTAPRWSGAAELRAEEAIRVGSLYLVGEILYFVDGGRTDKRVKPHEALFALAAALSTAPLTIEAYVFLWVEGGKGMAATVAQIVTALVTIALAATGVWARNSMMAADAAGMEQLAAMDDIPDLRFLNEWTIEDGGSFRLPLVDIESCTVEDERVQLVTRLLDRYTLTVQPDRDRLVALLQSARVADEEVASVGDGSVGGPTVGLEHLPPNGEVTPEAGPA